MPGWDIILDMDWLIGFNLWAIYKKLMALSWVGSWDSSSHISVQQEQVLCWIHDEAVHALGSGRLGSAPWTALCRDTLCWHSSINHSRSSAKRHDKKKPGIFQKFDQEYTHAYIISLIFCIYSTINYSIPRKSRPF